DSTATARVMRPRSLRSPRKRRVMVSELEEGDGDGEGANDAGAVLHRKGDLDDVGLGGVVEDGLVAQLRALAAVEGPAPLGLVALPVVGGEPRGAHQRALVVHDE